MATVAKMIFFILCIHLFQVGADDEGCLRGSLHLLDSEFGIDLGQDNALGSNLQQH